MEDKITPARVGAYAARLARRVCDTALTGQEAVEGPAMLSLSPVRQLNLLVLHSLMHRWKQETLRLRSPYFNYEAPEVQQALTGLMGTLSRHIRVRRADLEPLVAEAATDALGLAFDPATTYATRFVPETAADEPFSADALRTELKYVEVNKGLLENFIGSLPPTTLDRAAVLSRLKLYATAHFRELAAPEDLLRQLAEIEPVTLADLREPAGPRPAAPLPAPPPPVAAPVAAPRPEPAPAAPAAELSKPAPAPTPVVEAPKPAPAPVVEAPKPAPAPVVEAPKPAPVPAAETPKPAPTPAPRAPLVAVDAPATPLHEKLRQEKVTLNDQLRSKVPDVPGLAEKFESNAKVTSIAAGININQRIAFTGELFDSNKAAYDAAIQHLDALPTAEQARAYVTDELAVARGWADKTDLVQKLLRLIDRKFA